MQLQQGSNYYICFIETSDPSNPTLEMLAKKFKDILAFPVAGSIDGIIIAHRAIRENCERYTLIFSSLDNFSPNKNYAFLHFYINNLPKCILNTKSAVFKRQSSDEWLVLVEYNLNTQLDKLWKCLYKESNNIRSIGTYCVFTLEYAQHS